MDEDKRKHLDYLQVVITRMNTNSFQIKNMAVVILTAMFALFAATPKVLLIFLAGFPLIVFWILDAYYLQQERKFRALFKDVAGLTNQFEIVTYDMSLDKYNGNGCSFGESLFSKTILIFYIPLFAIVIIIAVIFMVLLNIQLL
jgi:hypothetical protein